MIEPHYPKGIGAGRPPIGLKRMLLLRNGTIVEATLIAAAPSTKNKDKQRDREVHQSKKGNRWLFGMKAHIGVDVESGRVHSVVGTAGNVADVTQIEKLHGEEQCIFADACCTGAEKRAAVADKDLDWYIARKRGVIAKAKQGSAYRKAMEAVERAKASARALVEHPFHLIKNPFRHRKVRYRRIEKNTDQLYTLFGLANLVLSRRKLSPHREVIASAA